MLRERGLDTRLIRVDEAAPIYFINQVESPEKLPKYELIVSDGDMYNRVEQNRLLYRTMLHFGYPESRVGFRLMEGYSHCGYCGAMKDGKSLFAEEYRFYRKMHKARLSVPGLLTGFFASIKIYETNRRVIEKNILETAIITSAS